jgi:hypothetical protein
VAPAVLIRAKLTAAEWAAIRKLAIDRSTPVSHLVAETLRKHLLKEA